MLERKEMGEKKYEGRNWSFGYGGYEGYENQNPKLNQRNEGSSDGSGENGGWLDHSGGNTWGNSGTTTRPASNGHLTANAPANSPWTTQGQTNYPTQAPAPGQATNTQGDDGGGTRTLPTQPDRGHSVHTGLHTSILGSPASVTIIIDSKTTFATQYTGGDTLAVDTQAFTFSSGPQPTSGAGGFNNFNSGANNQGMGANGAANSQNTHGGLGGGAIAGIIVGVVLLLVISLVALFFRKRKNSRLDNSPYGKHHQEETRSSLLDTGLAASAAAGAAAVGARAGYGGHGAADTSPTAALHNNIPAQPAQQPLMQETNNNNNPQYLVQAGSHHMAPRPAPSPPSSAPQQSNHSANPSRGNRMSVSIISPPATHISSALTPGTVSPISPVSPAVLAPPSPPSPDHGENGGGGLGRRSSIGSVSTLSIHSAMMTASQLNWPMPPSVASTSSPSVPLTATPSGSAKPPQVPSPHYLDFEEQGRTVVRINRESLGSGGGIGGAR